MSFKWHGKDVQKKMTAAAIRAVNFGMAGAVAVAKNNHAWQNRTGTTEGSIRIVEVAQARRGIVAGLWGSVDVPHILALEFGAKPHVIKPRRANGVLAFVKDGQTVFARKVNHPGNKAMPFLRPANRKAKRVLRNLLKREFARA